MTTDDHALEDLDPGSVAFDDLDVHLDGVAGAEVGMSSRGKAFVDVVEVVHRILLPCRATGRRCWVCRLGAGPGRAECLRSPVAGPLLMPDATGHSARPPAQAEIRRASQHPAPGIGSTRADLHDAGRPRPRVVVSGPADGIPLVYHHGTPGSAHQSRSTARARTRSACAWSPSPDPGMADRTVGRALRGRCRRGRHRHPRHPRCGPPDGRLVRGGPHALATAAALGDRVAGRWSSPG